MTARKRQQPSGRFGGIRVSMIRSGANVMKPAPIRLTDPPGELLETVRARTPARILVGRAGSSYRTATQLTLRSDHAAALDAVHAEIDLERDLGPELIRRFAIVEVASSARDKAEYLRRPDL